LNYFDFFEEHFKTNCNIQIDKACKDVSRTCFLSHDRDVYYRDPNEVKEIELRSNVHPILDFAKQFILESKDGEKHIRLRNISFLLGGYCTAGHIEADKALNCLKESIVERGNLTSKTNAFITIDKSFNSGLEFPISDEDSNKFQSFDYKIMSEETIGINIPKESNDSQVNIVYAKHLFNSIPSVVKDIIEKFSYGDNSTVLL
ncbi:MAG: BT4734/BF3469 family protein, partial [Candidatus Kapaibacterium sp.]